ncbi:MAG: Jag N-terminal domain-containing protein [Christensenellales bacterium]
MRIKEFTGKTTQEAIDNGLAELGVTIADVHVDVLQEGAKGLFGLFGSKPACVRLTVMEDEREDDHGLSDLLGSFSLNEQKKKSAPKPAAPKPAAPKAEAPKPDMPKAEAPKPDMPKAEVRPEKKPEMKPEKKPEAKPAAPKADAKPEAPKAETKPEKKPEAP